MTDHDIYLHIFEAYVDEDVRPLFNPDSTSFNGNYRNSKAAIYGDSDKDLKEQLDTFRGFPGSRKEFGLTGRSFFTICSTYRTVQDTEEKYIYKKELITRMKHQLPNGILNWKMDEELIQFILEQYLMYKEGQIEGDWELILLDEREFKNLNDDLVEQVVSFHFRFICRNGGIVSEIPHSGLVWKIKSFNDALKLLTNKFEELWPGVNTTELERLIRTIVKQMQARDAIQAVLSAVDIFEKFFRGHKKWFEPGHRQHLRMFMRLDLKFFLVSEVLREFELEELAGGTFEEELREMVEKDELATISYEILNERWKENVRDKPIENVTMIEYVVKQTKRRAIFIPFNKTENCILIADAFWELLLWMISVKGIFQVLKENDWDEFLQLFDAFGPDFKNKIEGAPRFIEVKKARIIKEGIRLAFNKKYGALLSNVVDVTPVGENGFELADFEEQIRTMGIEKFSKEKYETCPYHAFQSVRQGKAAVLKTCDMYDALERCQLWAFFEKFPELFEFLKNQGLFVDPHQNYQALPELISRF